MSRLFLTAVGFLCCLFFFFFFTLSVWKQCGFQTIGGISNREPNFVRIRSVFIFPLSFYSQRTPCGDSGTNKYYGIKGKRVSGKSSDTLTWQSAHCILVKKFLDLRISLQVLNSAGGKVASPHQGWPVFPLVEEEPVLSCTLMYQYRFCLQLACKIYIEFQIHPKWRGQCQTRAQSTQVPWQLALPKISIWCICSMAFSRCFKCSVALLLLVEQFV